MIKRLIPIFFLLLGVNLNAAELADVQFDDTIVLPDGDQPLVLNGLGIRYKFFFKIYIAGLYLTEKTVNAETILSDTRPNRMVMHFLYDEVGRDKLVDGWNEGFENNLADAELEKLKPRIEQFNGFFETMKQGEVIHLDYIPGKGTAVTIKGEQKGVIPGHDFNRALLGIWLGDYPVGDDLKQNLLGE